MTPTKPKTSPKVFNTPKMPKAGVKTPAAYNAAPKAKTPASRASRARRPSEHSDQVKVVMHVRTFYPNVIIAAVPNGAAVSAAQRMRLVAEGLLPGFPDLMVCEPIKPWHGLFVEMKSTAKTAHVDVKQIAVHDKLRAKGYRIVVARGYEDAKTQILAYLQGRSVGAVE